MVIYKVGNLLTAFDQKEIDVIAHQCNVYCNMGAGIAPQIARKYPPAWEADKRTKVGDMTKLGHFTMALTHKGLVFNLYGQGSPSATTRQTDYDALRQALRGMVKFLEGAGGSFNIGKGVVGLPKIGAGLGGGDWNVIEKIIDEEFKDRIVIVYVLKEEEIPNGFSGNQEPA